MTTPILRQAAQALLSVLDGIEGSMPLAMSLASEALRAALAAPESTYPNDGPLFTAERLDEMAEWDDTPADQCDLMHHAATKLRELAPNHDPGPCDDPSCETCDADHAPGAPEPGDPACPVVAYMLRSGHGTAFAETLLPDHAALVHAGRPMWEQLVRHSDHLAAIAAKDAQHQSDCDGWRAVVDGQHRIMGEQAAEIAALKATLSESCAGQRYETGEPHIGPCSEVVRLRAEAAAFKADAERLDAMAAHTSWELSYSWESEEDEPWQVYGVTGSRNDREWHLVAKGRTPREAIDKARQPAPIVKESKT